MTAAVAASVPVRPVVREAGPSLPALVGLEIRKSLSTRSGLALAGVSLLLAPAAMTLAGAAGENFGGIAGPVAVVGMLSNLVLLALGVLSTAGEWSHGTVQTTYLLVPRRGRVLATKTVAVAALGAVYSAVAAVSSALVLTALQPDLAWTGAGRAVLAVIAAGAVFAAMGAGVGAALGNTPGALTGLYLFFLGVMPVLQIVKPSIADAIDPGNAVLNLAQGRDQTSAVLLLTAWLVVSLVAGAVLTRRRAVQ
jgi:ABC-2 type transport system permease protein